ncbi:MAG: pseudaminic acid biosynthesis-associated methylase [Verrucomicrobia bacterium]|nr:pseudaminic acid biosynthesis-associated methylase [Verrucomicrobiota bacterium]
MSKALRSAGKYRSEQEAFWAGSFGNAYIGRNRDAGLIASNLALFSRVLERTNGIGSVIELGANIGLNLKAIRDLLPQAACTGVEINAKAVQTLKKIPGVKAIHSSLYDFRATPHDFAFTKTVLIHQRPDLLPQAYDQLASSSRRFVAIIEYYNPNPVEVVYRGHSEKLFKRDFAHEFMDRHQSFRLVEYGFVYRHDAMFPQDDLTWFLLERQPARR